MARCRIGEIEMTIAVMGEVKSKLGAGTHGTRVAKVVIWSTSETARSGNVSIYAACEPVA